MAMSYYKFFQFHKYKDNHQKHKKQRKHVSGVSYAKIYIRERYSIEHNIAIGSCVSTLLVIQNLSVSFKGFSNLG